MPDEYKKAERALIESALKDPLVSIPQALRNEYLKYQKQHVFKYLFQINLLAQAAYAGYTLSDWFIFEDIQILAVILKLGYTAILTAITCWFYLRSISVTLFDRLLPISIIGASAIWMFLLNLSDSLLTETYQYAALVFIVLANICVQIQFRTALICSLLISCIICVGMYFNVGGHAKQVLLFTLIYFPVFLFSLYISWNSTLKSRTLFLQYLLDEYNRQALDQMAFTDMLTGINNRRSFKHLADNEILQHPQQENTILIFDVDYFKKINDTYGHDVGDEVLKHIVSLTKNILRRDDIFARFGGEEFIVFLPATSKDDAFKIAERIRTAIADQVLYFNKQQIKMSISAGLSVFSAEENALHIAIKQADQALYMSKRSGRNKTQIWSEKPMLKEH